MKRLICTAVITGMATILCSCASAPIRPPEYSTKDIISLPTAPILRKDIIHTVAPGETVWRIAKMYDIETKDIMRANTLKRPKELKMGRRLLIPDAAPLKAVIPLYPSKKWKYIIIHHSATDEGSALHFHIAHHLRGFKRGLGYHFVIDNGTRGKEDGHIEVSPRWLKQLDGAHCKASGMNKKGIGICLVGNFNKERISKKQMDSLLYLVNCLRKHYKIPLKNIMGHNQVFGARTECPGKNFPLSEFKKQLKVFN
ncbi:N-acetylmuramoyl-L-alanine amidase [Patescibacteria group bacterium]|nr:N-acetylmuramoyl-L-alanine amidase [Patescibacteria group bacterium]